MTLDEHLRTLLRDVVREVMREELAANRSELHSGVEPSLVSVTDACKVLGIGRSMLLEMSEEQLPRVFVGRRRLYRLADLRALAAEQ